MGMGNPCWERNLLVWAEGPLVPVNRDDELSRDDFERLFLFWVDVFAAEMFCIRLIPDLVSHELPVRI